MKIKESENWMCTVHMQSTWRAQASTHLEKKIQRNNNHSKNTHEETNQQKQNWEAKINENKTQIEAKYRILLLLLLLRKTDISLWVFSSVGIFLLL